MNTGSALAVLALALCSAASARTETREAYQRAQRYIGWNNGRNVFNREVEHHWIGKSDRLWYRRGSPEGSEFIIVDAKRGTKSQAFDHQAMARALASALGRAVDARALPIEDLSYESARAVPDVLVAGQLWGCDLQISRCVAREPLAVAPGELLAPDGRQVLFVKDHNLRVRALDTGESRALTVDGDKDRSYSALPESNTLEITMRRQGKRIPPIGIFSPDGSRFATYRLDQSRVKPLWLLQNVPQDGSVRPILHEYRYPFPGDELPTAQLLIIDVATGRSVTVDYPALMAPYVGPVMMHQLSWSADGRTLHLLDSSRDYRTLSLLSIDGATGSVRKIMSERATLSYPVSHIIEENPLVRVLANGDFLWPSERSGSLHLYRYDGRTGSLRNAVTSGPWIVRDIVRIDEPAKLIYFTAIGLPGSADPYYRALYRVRLDGSGLTRLTPEDADHEVRSSGLPETALLEDFRPSWAGVSVSPESLGAFSASGRYFVDSYATPAQPTVTVIRDSAGRRLQTLERATLSADLASFIPPELFETLAADGRTKIYGQILKPTNFDPSRRYPVVDSVYPGPQAGRVSKRYFGDRFLEPQSVAELGFIVVELDGRGTPLRPLAFREFAYGNMGAAGGLVDHVAAIKQLAATRPYMDLDRVGVFGGSGGGYATVHALFDYPEFFKVGVATAGNHDQRIYVSNWGEMYHGPFDEESYAAIASYRNVAQFKGKLLLMCGELDDNVHPANTMRVVDALIRHDKPFDLLVFPNQNHGIGSPYYMKRLWDFLVVNLQGGVPPAGFVIEQDR